MSAATAEAKELELVGKVELRIALASDDEKLSGLLKVYLTPLLLKLASSSQAVRNKVVGVCNHISNRVQSPSVALPVAALVKQFHENDNNLIRLFDLRYIETGLERLSHADRTNVLFDVLKGLSILDQGSASSLPSRASILNIFLRLLPLWKLPARGTKEDIELRTSLGVDDATWKILSTWLTRFLVLEPNGSSSCLTQEEEAAFQLNKTPGYWATGSGNNMIQAKIAVANLLASGAFTKEEKFIAGVILLADNNASLESIGDIIFKQNTFNLESAEIVDNLFHLYFGQQHEPIRRPAHPKLQTRILTLLSKSKKATTYHDRILYLLQDDPGTSTGLEASKKRSQIFTFINWTAQVADESSKRAIAPSAVLELRDFIERQGWPSPGISGNRPSRAEVDLRAHAYESIGILSPYSSSFENLDLFKWLLTSLRCDNTDNQIFVSIEGAVGRAINELAKEWYSKDRIDLQRFLEWHMTAEIGDADSDYGLETKRVTKFVALRCANRCLGFDDHGRVWINLMAISSAEARQELVEEGRRGLDPYQFLLAQTDRHVPFKLPDFKDLTKHLFETKMVEISAKENIRALAIGIAFSRNVMLAHILGSRISLEDEPEWDRKLDNLIKNDREAREMVKSTLKKSPSPNTAEDGGHLLLLKGAFEGMKQKQDECGSYFVELLGFSTPEYLLQLLPAVESITELATANHLVNQVHASRSLGIICSSALSSTQQQALLDKLWLSTFGWESAVGAEVNRIRGGLLVQAFILTRLIWLSPSTETTYARLDSLMSRLVDVLSSRDEALRDAAQIGLGQLMLGGIERISSFAQENLQKISDPLFMDAKKGKESSVAALGRLASSLIKIDPKAWDDLMSRLRELHEVRQAELHFAVGEAMSVASAGWQSQSLMTEFDVEAGARGDPKTWSTTEDELVSATFEKTIEACRNTKPALRKASALWLLCLVQFIGHLEGGKRHLRKCQAAFATLLGDRDEVVQESGSRGLGLVYQIGDESLKRDLVRDLVQSFTSGNAKMSGQVEEDTELFEENALPTGDGASVKTYGEVVKLAQEVGDPSLVYRFMGLAANNRIWTSRAAFGRFGLSSVLSDSSLLAENSAFYPKLYRYRFDPNPNVQRSMNDIWTALVKDTNSVLDQHFDAILTDLLKSIVGREWRVREASCAAISDLIQGRDVQKYETYLEEIWSLAFRVGLDDIKETVRLAGMTLIRTLVTLLIRNLEVGDGESRRAQTMLSHAMPFLLQQLQKGATPEIAQYSVVTLTKIIKKAPNKSLRPYVPRLVESFIVSLTFLEPEIVNYIHLNASKYGLTSEKIDRARLSSTGRSPIMEALERCLDSLDDESFEPTMRALENAMKASIGLPSKAGASQLINSLCMRHSLFFRPHADRFARLVRRQVLDRNETVSISYSMSLAYLMRLVSDKEVEETIVHAQRLYFEADELSHRAVAGEILQSISKLANDRFMHFATGFLPFAYFGRHDSDEQVRELFEKTWKENVGGSRAVSLYQTEITTIAGKHIESPKWVVKHAAARTIADLIKTFDGSFDQKQTDAVWPVLEKALAGKTWEGKEEIVEALPIFASKSNSASSTNSSQMRKITVREAKRSNVKYRPYALKALGDYSKATGDHDLLPEMLEIIETVLEDLEDFDDDKMEVDGDTSLTSKL